MLFKNIIMSTEIAKANQVTDKELISYLDTLGLTSKLNENEKTAYLSIAKAFGLNPFKREVHVSKYSEQMSIITGYEVYIKRAERSGVLNGWGVQVTGSIDPNNPTQGDLKATITIHRKDRDIPFVWDAHYDECVQTTRDGKVTAFWKKPKFMLSKVAISQGFRLCFSDELGGMPYTADEMPQQEQKTEDVVHVEVQDSKKPLLKPGTKAWASAVKALREGKTVDDVKALADLTPENETLLLNAVEEAA